jgi:acyl-CoA dehydrogenase
VGFQLSDEQVQLRSVAADALADALPAAPDPIAPDAVAALLVLLADLGLAGILVPDEVGGSSGGLVEAALLAEQLGVHRAPGAVVATALVAAAALPLVAPAQRADVAAGIVAGRPTAVLVDVDLQWPPGPSGVAWGWAPECRVLVPSNGELVATDGTAFVPTDTADLLLKVGRLARDPNGLDGEPGTLPPDSSEEFLARVNVLLAALMVGHMTAALDASVEYAKQRMQYGAPIGSFQAVRHLCADMLVDVEASRSAAYGSAWSVDALGDPAAVRRAGAVAKAWCSEAGVRVCETALQVHGGIGFTWECGVHEHLRAVHVAGASFMPATNALDLIAAVPA